MAAAGAEDALLSRNERHFVLRAVHAGIRTDGRFLLASRQPSFHFSRGSASTSVQVSWGNSRALGVVSTSIATPFADRPSEGFLSFNVTMSPMAGPAHEGGRSSPLTAQLSRTLERQIRDSRALDVEALCITPGERVWSLRVDVTVLNDDGNLTDVCALAAIAALRYTRLPDVSVRGGSTMVVHDASERALVPLALHHIPVCITFAIFDHPLAALAASVGETNLEVAAAAFHIPADAAHARRAGDERIDVGDTEVIVLDPSAREELVASGSLSCVVNSYKELCGVHKLGGCALSTDAIMACVKVAGEQAAHIVAQLSAALEEAEAESLRRAQVRQAGAQGIAAEGSLTVG